MQAIKILLRPLSHYSLKNQKVLRPISGTSIFPENEPQKWRYQTRRTLILEPNSSQFVSLQRLSDSDSGIVEVNLNRPERKNAIGKDLLRGLQQALEAISRDSSSNVVILRSLVPNVFCAGADLKERKTLTQSEVQSFVDSLRSTFSFIETICVPSIAVIEGAALGGGLEMALSCDLRICGLPETGLAIIPGAGGTQRLPRLVGKAIAKELIFTGRKISGKAAMSIGLVNHCVPAGQAHLKALEIAREINEKGPLAIRMAKKAINEGLEVNMDSGLAVEHDCYEQLLDTKDRLEGLAAFAEKRKPNYTGE
ncbi:Crotonase superfamily [Parasponia andersonii]|uniref:Crotonase superfamily n=1 Tax=Parasponia andersonii TaxID=3476 RepID=A0A2P5CU61_PARAD|nr:Crotonase superfamily [Parasponia andersonii]